MPFPISEDVFDRRFVSNVPAVRYPAAAQESGLQIYPGLLPLKRVRVQLESMRGAAYCISKSYSSSTAVNPTVAAMHSVSSRPQPMLTKKRMRILVAPVTSVNETPSAAATSIQARWSFSLTTAKGG